MIDDWGTLNFSQTEQAKARCRPRTPRIEGSRQRGYVAAPRKWHELVGASGADALAAAEETAEAPLEAKATAKAPQ